MSMTLNRANDLSDPRNAPLDNSEFCVCGERLPDDEMEVTINGDRVCPECQMKVGLFTRQQLLENQLDEYHRQLADCKEGSREAKSLHFLIQETLHDLAPDCFLSAVGRL